MNKPVRVQRKRSKGWRMPENTVNVGRPSVWGNPFKVEGNNRLKAVRKFRQFMKMPQSKIAEQFGINAMTLIALRIELIKRLPELKGKNLACWCPLDQPCHADVLLEMANRRTKSP